MARSARCDVRWQAAVFVEPDETAVSEDLLHSDAFRRPLLQIGGANIAAARIAPSSSPTSSSLADDKACLLAPPQHGEGRDPQGLIAPLAVARRPMARSARRPMARSARIVAIGSLTLDAMFAGRPPSSSNPTKRPSRRIFSTPTRFVGLSCRSAARTSRPRESRLRAPARSVSEVSPSPSWHNSAGTLQVLAQ